MRKSLRGGQGPPAHPSDADTERSVETPTAKRGKAGGPFPTQTEHRVPSEERKGSHVLGAPEPAFLCISLVSPSSTQAQLLRTSMVTCNSEI
jgi:hypothetical protein